MGEPSPGARLRAAVNQGACPIPGVFNPLVARVVEEAGFAAGYVSGAAFSAAGLALPDVGLFTLTELAQHVATICRATHLPLLVDADTGFGEAVNVERTVHELEAAGAAGLQLEDQQFPKRCGHLSGKALVAPDTMCAKLRAAAAARSDEDFVLVARTDARGVTGLEDAVARAQAYLDAGADWIFPEALRTREEFAEFARRIDAPLIANMTEFGQSPLLSVAELADLGYVAVLFPVTLLRVAMKAVEAAVYTLATDGSQRELLELMQTRQELYDLLDYSGYEARDRAYFSAPDLDRDK